MPAPTGWAPQDGEELSQIVNRSQPVRSSSITLR
ncbi:hypothetical protein ACVIWV_004085 [Bradyrhizobium diazoefficiens]